MRKLLKKIVYTVFIFFLLLNVMAAFHAYKFTHFYDTKEPKAHFRAEEADFWNKANALLFGIKSYKKPLNTIPELFRSIYFTTSDSIRLEAWQSTEASLDSEGTVIMFHGHGGNKAGVLNEAKAFLGFNYKVLLVDFRAHGNSYGNVCTIGFDEAKDVKAAYDYVVATGEKNIILYGISLGAAAEMKAVKDYKLTPSKMILEMPFGSLLEAVKGRCRILGVPVQPTATLLTFWGGVEQGFWAFDHNPSEYARQINCPVLLQWGEKDVRVSNAETKSIFKNLSSSQKQLVSYRESGHQSLYTSEPEKWLKVVTAFLQSNTLPGK